MSAWLKTFLAAIALTIATLALADAPTVRAWLDRDTAHVGETVTLNVELSDRVEAQPDFGALAKDFNLLGTQSSQQMSLVNGASSAKTLWAIALEPKHDGRIAIPALTVAGAKTEPLTLTVLPQPAGAQGAAGDDVYIEMEAEPLAPYVQQQVRATVKLFYALDLTDGSLDDPRADGVLVQKLGQDKRYLATVGTRRYQVVERHYALTPERSGELKLPAIAFRGHALDGADRFGFFNRGRSVTARSDALALNVKPKPADWTGAWLPAQSLALTEESAPPAQIRVGDPLTRTVRVQAQGLGFEQLPEIEQTAPAGADVYPDKAATQTRDDGAWLFGERSRKFAFVPTKPGTLTLPAISVRWWDTQHDRAAVAELPAQTIEVLPASGDVAATKSPNAAIAPSQNESAPIAMAPNATNDVVVAASGDAATHRWQLIATVVLILWALTLAAWWRSRRLTVAAPALSAPPPASGSASASLRAACRGGDLAAISTALLRWGRERDPSLRNLGELAARVDSADQSALLIEIERARFGSGVDAGLGARVARAFADGPVWPRAKRASIDRAPLPDLYPPSR